jgi:hypothetical protein
MSCFAQILIALANKRLLACWPERDHKPTMKAPHNENSRVKIPAILHLCRLGYSYQILKDCRRDEPTSSRMSSMKVSLA